MPQAARIRATELPTRGLHGHALRRVQKLNATLRQTRRLVAESEEDPKQSLALLVVETRVLALNMGRYEFGQAAQMHFHAVKNVETPGTQPQHESLSRVYRTWLRFAQRGAGSHSAAARKQVRAAAARLLELLVPVQDEYGRPLRRTVEGLYWKWMYQVGRAAFEKASARANRLRKPLTYGALWQRHESQMSPDFEEVRLIAKHLDRDLDEAAAIWSEHKTSQLTARGVQAPLVRLTVEIQKQFAGLRMTAQSVRRQCGVTLKVAQAITNGQMVAASEVRPLIDKVIPPRERSEFVDAWNQAYQPDNEDFAAAFPRIRDQNGWSNHMIAALLRVRAPEKREGGGGRRSGRQRKARPRIEAFRPAAEIRRMYQNNAFATQAPAAAAIELIASANSAVNDQGESQKDYLQRLFLEGVDQRLRRKGSGAQGSAIRKYRILCGVTPEKLAELCGESKDELLLIERGLRRVRAAQEKRLIRLMQQYAQEKVAAARRELSRLTAAPQTVREAVTLLRERHGGYIPLSRLLHDEHDRRFSFAPDRLRRIAAGREVPPLPVLRSLVKRAGSEVVPELVRDWYEWMPGYLAAHPKLRWKHPLARGFGIVVFESWNSLRDFWKEHFEGDFSHSVLTRNFQQLNGRGYQLAWPTVSRYLNAAAIGLDDPRRLFWQRLFAQHTKIRDAIARRDTAAVRRAVRAALRRWRTEIEEAGGDPSTVEYQLGLLPEERARG